MLHCVVGVGEDTELVATGRRLRGCCVVAHLEVGEDAVVFGDPAAMRRFAEYVLRAVDNAERIPDLANGSCPDCVGER